MSKHVKILIVSIVVATAVIGGIVTPFALQASSKTPSIYSPTQNLAQNPTEGQTTTTESNTTFNAPDESTIPEERKIYSERLRDEFSRLTFFWRITFPFKFSPALVQGGIRIYHEEFQQYNDSYSIPFPPKDGKIHLVFEGETYILYL